MPIAIVDTSDRIRIARRAAGIPQKTLARRLGIGEKRFSNYELGYAPIPITIVARIAEALGLSFNELFQDRSGSNVA